MIQCIYGGKTVQARSHAFVEIDYETLSTVIVLLPLIQEGLVSVTSESICTKLSHPCPEKKWLDMTIVVDLCGSILFAKVHI